MNSTSTLFEQLLDMAQLFMSHVYAFATSIIWFFVTPIIDIVAYYDPLNISGIFINPVYLLIRDYTLLELFFGIGIGIYLVYQFITWLLNLVT